jgi:hypothetical protein
VAAAVLAGAAQHGVGPRVVERRVVGQRGVG